MDKIDTDKLRWIVTEATPGPWTSSYRGTRRDFANGRDFFRITSADEASDPDATAIVHVQWRNDRAANARLIALAPDLAAEVLQLREALQALHHAVCGETGFAEAVRLNSGLAYPWPALDISDEMARAALSHPVRKDDPHD